jgi:hypothetical protein
MTKQGRIFMEDIARELYECLMERIYGGDKFVQKLGASPRERSALNAFLNRGYESVKTND